MVAGIENYIQVPSNKYDDIVTRMSQHDNEIKDLRKRVEMIEHNEQSAQDEKDIR